MNLAREIQKLFASSSSMTAIPIENLPRDCKAWVIRTNRDYGVCVEVAEEVQINEKFAGAHLWTGNFQIDGEAKHLLMLTSDREYLRMEFSVICSQFVDPGMDGSNRKMLQSNPLEWWDRWRSLLGNKYHEKSVHGLLGELIAYLTLLKRGEKPDWTGAGGGSIDFVAKTRDYEVKSTLSRYEVQVQIAGQYQLNRNADKPLSMILVRLEPSSDGYCINDIVDELIVNGVEKYYLESELSDLGFEEGASSRSRRFKLHEIRHYEVDENFPRITLDSFKDGKLPDGVKHITYSVDLTGVKYETWSFG